MSYSLEAAGHRVLTALDGVSALDLATSAPKQRSSTAPLSRPGPRS